MGNLAGPGPNGNLERGGRSDVVKMFYAEDCNPETGDIESHRENGNSVLRYSVK